MSNVYTWPAVCPKCGGYKAPFTVWGGLPCRCPPLRVVSISTDTKAPEPSGEPEEYDWGDEPPNGNTTLRQAINALIDYAMLTGVKDSTLARLIGDVYRAAV